jgi:hypothetical protein
VGGTWILVAALLAPADAADRAVAAGAVGLTYGASAWLLGASFGAHRGHELGALGDPLALELGGAAFAAGGLAAALLTTNTERRDVLVGAFGAMGVFEAALALGAVQAVTEDAPQRETAFSYRLPGALMLGIGTLALVSVAAFGPEPAPGGVAFRF